MAKYDGRDGYQGKVITKPIKAIRQFCLDCIGDGNNYNYVRDCTGWTCPLFPFRFGINPYNPNFKSSATSDAEIDFDDEE